MLRAAFIVLVVHSALIGSSGSAQNPATGAPFEVRMSIECFDRNRFAWSPVGYLHPRDFRVSENQLTFPVSVLQPALKENKHNRPTVPTRLLIIVDDPTTSSVVNMENLLLSLEPALRRAWDVGVLSASGRFTGYASSEGALRALLASADESRQQPAASATTLAQELIDFRGRRVLLYVPFPSQKAWIGDFPQPLLDATSQIMVDRYIVDGGLLNSYHSPHKVQDSCDQGGINVDRPFPWQDYALPLPNSHPLSALKNGIYHEVDLRTAIQGMTRDAAGFYDLQIGCARTRCPDPAGPLSIQVQKDIPLTITYEGFGQAQDAAIQVTLRP